MVLSHTKREFFMYSFAVFFDFEELLDFMGYEEVEEVEEEYEYDEDGVAYWYDEENEVYYWYDEESDDWYECE
jgi:hypothetical protein